MIRKIAYTAMMAGIAMMAAGTLSVAFLYSTTGTGMPSWLAWAATTAVSGMVLTAAGIAMVDRMDQMDMRAHEERTKRERELRLLER